MRRLGCRREVDLTSDGDSNDGGKLLGIFNERDALKCSAAECRGEGRGVMDQPV